MPAMTVPLLKNKVDDWKTWCSECMGSRREEFDDFNRRMGLTDHRAWLDDGPSGPLVIVLHDGPGSGTMLEKLATSDHPFDTWFRDHIIEYHGMDFTRPMPGDPPMNTIDWRAGTSAREARS
jgi:hypothetical protein